MEPVEIYDNMIVIQVENLQQKMRKSVLAEESPVFAALFSDGHVSLSDRHQLVVSQDVVQGCHVLHLTGLVKASEFVLFAKALHVPRWLQNECTGRQYAVILQCSHTFQATRLVNEVTNLLYNAYIQQPLWEHVLPKTLPPHTGQPLDLRSGGDQQWKTDWTILVAAKRVGKKVLLPLATTALCLAHAADPTAVLDPSAATVVRVMQPKLWALAARCAFPAGAARCACPAQCARVRALVRSAADAAPYPLQPVDVGLGQVSALCGPCLRQFDEAYRAGLSEVVQMIPRAYGCPEWGELLVTL